MPTRSDRPRASHAAAATAVGAAALCCHSVSLTLAFSNPSRPRLVGVSSPSHHVTFRESCSLQIHHNIESSSKATLENINEDEDQVMAFVDVSGESGIDCYLDSYATIDGVEYTIGSPCDYAVALCHFAGRDEQLIPIDLDNPLMDVIFPIAEGIIEDEFGEELVLLRTPQTLTLVGELEESELTEEDDINDGGIGDDINDTEEEVEILVSFEEDGQEYHLVRLLDPVLLVGKAGNEQVKTLLTPEESDKVMPKLEEMFMSYQEDRDGDL